MSGRNTLFTPEIRDTIYKAIASGTKVTGACALAGIHPTTYHLWMAIGRAVKEGKAHKNKPKDKDRQGEYLQFFEAIKRAEGANQARAVSNIFRAGGETWTHLQTGVVRRSPPEPITWMNTETGDLMFSDPKLIDPALPEDLWQKQWSGEVWKHDAGQWTANAWLLERAGPEWQRVQTVRLEGDVDVPLINKVIAALAERGLDASEVFRAMVEEATGETVSES